MEVTVVRGRNVILAGLAALVLAVIGYAWLDGGREDIREISQPLPLPGTPS